MSKEQEVTALLDQFSRIVNTLGVLSDALANGELFPNGERESLMLDQCVSDLADWIQNAEPYIKGSEN